MCPGRTACTSFFWIFRARNFECPGHGFEYPGTECQDISKKSVPGYSKKVGKIGGKLGKKGLIQMTFCMAAKVPEGARAARHAEFVC